MKRGKKYVEAAKAVDRATLYDTAEAISLVKKAAVAKFDETIEAHIRTGCDGRHADQQIRGAVVLPHGTGKKVRVLVFAKDAKAEEAKAAGAEFVGAEELIPKIQNEGWLDFDVVVATPDMMGVVGRLGRVLGPKGLMPNPKAGTVTMDVTKAVHDIKAGKIEYRLDKTNIIHVPIGKASFTDRVLGPKGLMPNPKAGTVTMDVTKAVHDIKAGKIEYRLDKTNIIHVPIGKASFTEEQLSDNFQTLIGAILKARPSTLKGQYLRSVTIAPTMGVPIGKASFTEEQLSDNFQTLIGAILKARPSTLKGQYLRSVTIAPTMGPGVKINPMKLA